MFIVSASGVRKLQFSTVNYVCMCVMPIHGFFKQYTATQNKLYPPPQKKKKNKCNAGYQPAVTEHTAMAAKARSTSLIFCNQCVHPVGVHTGKW